MLCYICETDNPEGSIFCGNCGAQFKKDEPEMPSENVADTSANSEGTDEGSTTVLTNEMLAESIAADREDESNADSAFSPIDQNIAPQPAENPQNSIQPDMSVPFGGMTDFNSVNANTQNFVDPQAGVAQPYIDPNMTSQFNGMQMQNNDSVKAPKAPKQKSGKGHLVYTIISIILILALAGGMTYGYFYYDKKVGGLKDDKKELETKVTNLESIAEDYLSVQADNEDLSSQIEELEATIEDNNLTIEELTSTVNDANSTVTTYGGLIDYAIQANGQGNNTIFCSDQIIHLGSGSTDVKVFYAGDDTINYECSNTNVATCEWVDGWEGDIATLTITPVASGNTVIFISDEATGETVSLYVYVD